MQALKKGKMKNEKGKMKQMKREKGKMKIAVSYLCVILAISAC